MYKCKNYYDMKYCVNCGKNGHIIKECKEPIISIGIICIKSKNGELKEKLLEQFTHKRNTNITKEINRQCISSKEILKHTKREVNSSLFLNIIDTNTSNLNTIVNINKIHRDLEFLLIQRKHSLGFVEFMRGRYNTENYIQIIHLFEQMTLKEIQKIAEGDFDKLWNDLWENSNTFKFVQTDYFKSKMKFKYLEDKKDGFNLKFFTKNILPKWDVAEWGFPKGRRGFRESNIKCAMREFQEETGLLETQYTILNKLQPIKEVFRGTNNISYKLIYFIAILNDENVQLPKINSNEIGNIGWFDYTKSVTIIRDYHVEKKKCLNEIIQFLSQFYIPS